MDWSRTGSYIDLLLWTLLTGLVWTGGWLLCKTVLPLRRRERLPGGLAAGLLLFVLFSNLLAQAIDLTWAYWLAAAGVLALGIVAAWRERKGAAGVHVGAPVQAVDFTAGLPWLLALAALFVLFLGLNRGLALFDDYSNLPLVSLIASGDVPPHFYLNPEVVLDYHYGMHLLAASLVRIGGFYPWVALDIYKALSMALAAVLGVLWYRRSMRPGAALLVGGLFLLFAGGSRWLLLLLPGGWLEALSRGLELVGSGMQTAQNLPLALAGPWRIEGDGPTPFLFAFVSGIARPLTLALGGNSAMPSVALFLLLLAARRRWQPVQGLAFGLALSALALISDHLFLIAWGGLLAAALLYAGQRRSLRAVYDWVWPLLPGALLAPLMGGVLAGVIQRLLASGSGELAEGTLTLPGMALRWPPAVFSSHLGALELTDPGRLLLALIEIGPLLLLAFPVTAAIPGWLRRRKLLAAGLGIMAVVAFCAPLVVRFVERERDITRLFSTALTLWSVLGLPFAWRVYQRSGAYPRAALVGLFAVTIFGGLALLPPQLISLLQPQASFFVQEPDVSMSRMHWDRLEPGAWVLDRQYPFRPAALFARTTGPANENVYIEKPEFRELLASPWPHPAAESGYDYIYLSRETWSEMNENQRRPYTRGCARLVDEHRDKLGDFRRLYDIRRCVRPPATP
jgi:hypothetical protein